MTGDDFGLSTPVNDAIVKSHEKGILTTTSLMVSAPAAADAITRAKNLPDLNVGLHLVLSNGKATLAATEIPALVNENGEFNSNQISSGVKMFFNAAAKYQLEKEIRAQFEAFKATGLKLDHVNAHNHMHLHPTVFSLILTIGSEYGLTWPPLDVLDVRGKAMTPEKTTELCRGCLDDFYNGNNSLGVKECWSLKAARPATKYEIGTWTLPTQPGAFHEIKVYNCWRPDPRSGISHYDELPDCAKAP